MTTFDERIITLKNLNILDTPEEDIFDDIVKTASLVCNAPISLITLLDTDRQWFKAKTGVPITETPRDISVCSHTIEEEDNFMIINDLTKDDRFKDNPFVLGFPFVKSYAGVSLTAENGLRIGTICILDEKARAFSEVEMNFLQTFSKYVLCLINEKKKLEEIERQNQTLALLNKNLEAFTYSIAHDVKAPLRHIASFSSLLLRNKKGNLSESDKNNLSFINKAAKDLSNMTQNLLDFSKKTQLDSSDFEYVDMARMFRKMAIILNPNKAVKIELSQYFPTIFGSKQAMHQIFQNIISNAIKYRDVQKTESFIKIDFMEDDKYFRFTIIDNGIGISDSRKKELFQFFNKDTREVNSSGIGLCIVKEVLNKINGDIAIESEEFVGTEVVISLRKQK